MAPALSGSDLKSGRKLVCFPAVLTTAAQGGDRLGAGAGALSLSPPKASDGTAPGRTQRRGTASCHHVNGWACRREVGRRGRHTDMTGDSKEAALPGAWRTPNTRTSGYRKRLDPIPLPSTRHIPSHTLTEGPTLPVPAQSVRSGGGLGSWRALNMQTEQLSTSRGPFPA